MAEAFGSRKPRLSLGEPLALAGRPEGWLLFLACLAGLALLVGADATTRSSGTLGAVSVVPVFAAAWLLGVRLSIAVTALAAIGRILAVGLGGTDEVTVVAQIAILPFVAIVTRIGALALQETRERAAEDAMAARIAGIATSSQDLDEILRAILAELAGESFRGGTISLINERQELYIAASVGVLDPRVKAIRLPLGQGIMGKVAAEGVSMLVQDLDAPDAPDSPTRGIGSNAAMRSIAVAPLRAAGVVVGVIEVDSSRPHDLQEADLRRLEQAALAVSGAVQRAGALQLADSRLQERVRELALLLEAARGLVRASEVEDILRQIVRSCAEVAYREVHGARRAALWRLEGDEAELVQEYDEVGESHAGAPAKGSFPLREHPGLTAALDAGQSVELRRQLYAPILIGARPYAVIGVAGQEGASFSQEEMRLLDGMADLAGLALASAQKLDLERARASELQEHADRMAALDKIKSEFLRLASHELRGPLAVVRGYTAMLAEGSLGELPSLAAPVLPVLSEKGAEMSRLIDQMLETARLEDARVTLQLELADVRDLVQRAVDGLHQVPPTHRVSVVLPEEPVLAEVDSGRVATILGNLLDNALKYSPGGGEVRVRLTVAGDRARVEVADEGLGIDSDGMAVLFTRFGRIVTSENSNINGTGLGLYLSRELARMHGGEITATSEPGRGSEFVLELPLARSAVRA